MAIQIARNILTAFKKAMILFREHGERKICLCMFWHRGG